MAWLNFKNTWNVVIIAIWMSSLLSCLRHFLFSFLSFSVCAYVCGSQRMTGGNGFFPPPYGSQGGHPGHPARWQVPQLTETLPDSSVCLYCFDWLLFQLWARFPTFLHALDGQKLWLIKVIWDDKLPSSWLLGYWSRRIMSLSQCQLHMLTIYIELTLYIERHTVSKDQYINKRRNYGVEARNLYISVNILDLPSKMQLSLLEII